MATPAKRNLLFIAAAAASVAPALFALQRAQAPDVLAGLVAGILIGIAIIGLVRPRGCAG